MHGVALLAIKAKRTGSEVTTAMSSMETYTDGNGFLMPGFRFHPTEEELIDFYLRRKVEGQRFSVELITFLDLYSHDPWELPALASAGEKEWFFFVPRDRKYRNGSDRPNRVTISGYWKATGADRVVCRENSKPIGLKKTLVFYSGKAPKGIRTSWIMNEYRLPKPENLTFNKAEMSLCRVYKRAGLDDRCCSLFALSYRKHSQILTSAFREAFPFTEHEKLENLSGCINAEEAMHSFPTVPIASLSSYPKEVDRIQSRLLPAMLPEAASIDELRRVVNQPQLSNSW